MSVPQQTPAAERAENERCVSDTIRFCSKPARSLIRSASLRLAAMATQPEKYTQHAIQTAIEDALCVQWVCGYVVGQPYGTAPFARPQPGEPTAPDPAEIEAAEASAEADAEDAEERACIVAEATAEPVVEACPAEEPSASAVGKATEIIAECVAKASPPGTAPGGYDGAPRKVIEATPIKAASRPARQALPW